MMFASNSPYSPFFTSGLLSHSIFDTIWRGTPSTHDVQPHREYTSFLSLDLAESPASLKQKPSRSSRMSETDSLRSMPSPKPAPSATLPEVPNYPPRLPSLTPIPALEVPVPSSSLTISRTPAPLTAIRHLSIATKATSASVSTHVRKSNRSEALARLEGRSKHRPITLHIRHVKPQTYNFMNMSDDEDEEDDTDLKGPNSNHDVFSNPVLEPEDVVLPPFLQAPGSAPLPSQNGSFLATSHKTLVSSTLPLTSFMDLHNDDDSSSWVWRNFIQVANIS